MRRMPAKKVLGQAEKMTREVKTTSAMGTMIAEYECI
jgi:hypothetical protein